ncbi:hypothetical protein [Ochrobactrum sp. S1502_03]|uniref:hypothetical protein n=1 Tax=Ochrobactrum sp. S1502_03 TaxID=3108451 RepID=UPI0037C69E8D
MAILSDYTSGTISLAQGSVTVTGTGTLFEVTRFREGDTLQIQNLTAVIASVNSDTSLTLTEPWTGSTIVDGPYRARQLGDISRYPTQAATIIDLLGNGVLTNIAEIPVEEGKLLRGNAAGQYEAVPEDEIGIQDPNGSLAKLASLTLGNRQILQTDENGALKAIAILANKALVTDENKDLQQIDLGTFGRALLTLTAGTNAQYVQGDGTLQSKDGLPISTATQAALNSKIGVGQVLPAIASGGAGVVGMYALLRWGGDGVATPGTTTSGSNLSITDGTGSNWGSAPQGSWRLMSGSGTSSDQSRLGLWLRYA